MKTVEFLDSLPIEMDTNNPVRGRNIAYTVGQLLRQAKKSLRFQNYVPVDSSLGSRVGTAILLPEKVEKEVSLRQEKLVRAFFSDSAAPLKIIPKKTTMDIETKIKPMVERLRLRTEMGIVRLLKDKLSDDRRAIDGTDDGLGGEENLKRNADHSYAQESREERQRVAKVRLLEAVEDNPKIKDVYLPHLGQNV